MICKNCNTSFEGNFCPNCGQKAATHHIDHRFIFHEIPHAVLHIDKGIFYTIRELTLRPGITYLDYVKGKRTRHFSPIAYIIILSSIYLLIRSFTLHTFGDEEIVETHSLTGNLRQFHYIGFIFLSFTPVFALFSWVFFGKKSTLNYWELLVGNTYFLGHTIFIMILFMLMRVAFPPLLESGLFMIVEYSVEFLYLMFAQWQLFKNFYKNKVLLSGKVFVSLILSIGFSFYAFAWFVTMLEKLT